MDDKRNEMLFMVLSEDCEWRNHHGMCMACDKICKREFCMPFKFALFFNRPEIRR